MVELALAASVILPIFAGTFQFGYFYYVYNNLESSVRAAARHAALRTYDSATDTPSENFVTAVRNVALYGDPAGGVSPVAPGLAASQVTVRMAFANRVPSFVTVELNGYTLNGLFGSTVLSGKPKVTFPYVGRWDPV
jgi:Flp pilus assembly protein TadG